MNSGEISVGTVRTTDHQYKKHISQMKDYEIEAIKNAIDNNPYHSVKYSAHLKHKEGLNFNPNIITRVLSNKNIEENIIEFNIIKKEDQIIDCRLLLRDTQAYPFYDIASHKTINGNFCFVYSLINNCIVTAYWNKEKDEHKSMN